MSSLPLPSPLRRRWFFRQSETDQVLTVLAIFGGILVAARIFHTGRWTFVFMLWNLFLAYIPYFISTMLTRRSPGVNSTGKARSANKLVMIIGLLTWLLFIPNSFYILTDLYHLTDRHRNSRVPEWFDLILILSFALNGLLLGVRSTRQVEQLLAPEASFPGRWIFLYPIMWLNALGVYIGRDLRYNSWDIAMRPFGLLSDVFALIVHPIRHHLEWGMIGCYSILLTILYSLLTKHDGRTPS